MMKPKKTVLQRLVLVTSALVWCAVNVHAQSGPTITNQPASQTNVAGSTATFGVAVDGTGPFTYQWQFNGTNLPNNIISTVAGGGAYGYSGDGDAATNAFLGDPSGVAVDAAGNLYIADYENNCIRRVGTNGIITTVAGMGIGYWGDGGLAIYAFLHNPSDVALDMSGDLYIADYGNNRVRKVDTNGIITTVAGNGGTPFGGDGSAATNASLYGPMSLALDPAGNLYVADYNHNRIRKIGVDGIIRTVAGNGSTAFGGDGGAATNAGLSAPIAVAVDSAGSVYVSDTSHNRIRKIGADGIIRTVAGNGTNGYSGEGGAATNAAIRAGGVRVDSHGNLYIAEYGNNRIRRVGSDGIISTVAGNGVGAYAGDGGAATNASLYSPAQVAVDADGNLYIADEFNHRIRKVLLYAGYPTLTLGHVSGKDAGNYTVVVSNASGSVTSAVAVLTVLLPPSLLVPPASQFATVGTSPRFSVAVAGTEPFGYSWYFDSTNLVQSGTNSTLTLPNVSTNDAGGYLVVVANAYGSVTSQVATLTVGFPPTVVTQPTGQTNLAGSSLTLSVTAGGTGPFTYQWQFNGANLPNNIITTAAGNGNYSYSGDGGPATKAGLAYPESVGFDAAGNLYIADAASSRIRKVDAHGIITTVAGKSSGGYGGDGGAATNASLNGPNSVAWDSAGNLYIADKFNNRIRRVDTNGIITTAAGNGSTSFAGDGGAATNASLWLPTSVAFDAAGNWYIADQFHVRIRKVDPNGIIRTVAGGGSGGDGGAAINSNLGSPQGVGLDAKGNLYIADVGNNRIRKVNTDGIITTVAGNGAVGYSGDGLAATNARLASPASVAIGAQGDYYIADQGNNRVCKVDTNGIITTVAGNGAATYAGDGGAATNAGLGAACVALDAVGNLYIADDGNNRIREVHFAGDPSVALNNVSASSAGDYKVIVTSPYGSVTSEVAVLTVTIPRTPPQIITSDGSLGFQTNYFGFNLSGAFGQTIVVDGSTDLVGWTPLFTNTVVGSPFYFSDPASTNYPWRFYRARLP